MCLRHISVRFRTITAHNGIRPAWRMARVAVLAAAVLVLSAEAQVEAARADPVQGGTVEPDSAQTGTAWKRIAGTTIREGLAGPASGPIAAVWYAAGARRLSAQTESGRIFETSDFVHWRLNTTDTDPPPDAAAGSAIRPVSVPERGARVQAAATRLYAMGRANLYTSDDNGRTWLNLTGFNNRSVIGAGFTALAISPANP